MKTRHTSGLRFGPGLLTLLFAGALAGCCGSINCECDVTSASDVVLRADQDSLQGGFRKAELRSAYAVRYAPVGFATPVDTVALNLASGYIRLAFLPAAVPPVQTTARFTDYNYRFVLPNANRTYEVSNLEVATAVTGNCCACPTNTWRRFVLNGNAVVAEGGAAVTTLRR